MIFLFRCKKKILIFFAQKSTSTKKFSLKFKFVSIFLKTTSFQQKKKKKLQKYEKALYFQIAFFTFLVAENFTDTNFLFLEEDFKKPFFFFMAKRKMPQKNERR